jgi:hypothetical protein
MRIGVEFSSQKISVMSSVTELRELTRFVTLKKILFCMGNIKLIRNVQAIFVWRSVWNPEYN